MKKLLSTLLLLVVVLKLQAQVTPDFTVTSSQGIPFSYKILSGSEKHLDASQNEVEAMGTINAPTIDVIIPSSVIYGGTTYVVTAIGDFSYSKMKSLTFPPTVHNLGFPDRTRFQAVSIQNVYIPSTVTSIEQPAFTFSLGIGDIWLPSTGLKKIGYIAFVTNTLVHGLAQSQVEYIDENAFGSYYMTSSPAHINSLAVLPPTIREIGDNAFHAYGTDGLPLDEVVIPASMERLGESVYDIAHDVYIKGSNPFTLGTTPFGTQSTLKIHVPVDRSFTFKAASDWSSYTDKIVEELKIGSTGYTTYYLENENFQVPTGCTAYIITGSTPSGSISTPDHAIVKAFGAGKIIPKQTGFVLQGPANSTVVYQANVTGTEENVTGNLLVGTATEQEFSATGKKFYVLANGDQSIGFYKQGTRGGASIKLPAHRAGLSLDESIARSKEALFFDFDAARENSQTTGIESVSNVKQPQEDVVYDLQGRRVTNPTHGIYIINGKKVIK